jgi:hypothetical protein
MPTTFTFQFPTFHSTVTYQDTGRHGQLRTETPDDDKDQMLANNLGEFIMTMITKHGPALAAMTANEDWALLEMCYKGWCAG